nr:TetM/TetW/TetO/TetS family tetracycline resistance ribosomal protection protein [uncultured Devosia sp.]
MRTLNLGILAHVDAGKTSLTERLLFAAGVIAKVGSVDSGSTQTDTLALERQRGITIKAAVVSFPIGDVTVNLIDTPGHPDFIAEVERTLGVLDGAILVVSAVEGVQAQTRVLMRALQRLGIPTLIFVNKIDRAGADIGAVLAAIASRLTPDIVPMGQAVDTGSKAARFVPADFTTPDSQALLLDMLAERDDALLADYLGNPRTIVPERLEAALQTQSQAGLLHPVFFGSAIAGAGIEPLLAAIPRLLPALAGDDDAPVSGVVFKIDRGWAGDKLAYVRLFSGRLAVRDQVTCAGKGAVVTAIQLFDRGKAHAADQLTAGRVARISGLADARIGDIVGVAPPRAVAHHFAPPTLETQVVASRHGDRAALWQALAQLAEQDPLINLRKNDEEQQIFVSLYGEVQKEVIQQTLLDDFGLAIQFRESTIICVERPAASGHAVEFLFKQPNPFLATVGLRVDPMPPGSGVSFALEVDPGEMPAAFYRGVEEAVHETLHQGMHGWQVIDCHIAMTEVKHMSPVSTAGDFRQLTPLVLAEALRQGGTLVCEPIQHFELELPADALGPMLQLLGRAGATIETTTINGATARLEGEIRAACMQQVQQQLPGLTGGEGALGATFAHYRPVQGDIRSRPRSGPNPFTRREYLHRVRRKLAVSTADEAEP